MKLRIWYIMVLSLLLASAAFAYTPLSGTLLEEYQGIQLPSQILEIQQMPTSLLPTGIVSLKILPVYNSEQEIEGLELIGIGSSGELYWFGSVKFSGNYNPAKTDVFYDEEEGLVKILSQQPFSAFYYGARYRWDKDSQQLILLEEWSEDPSAEAMKEVYDLLEQGLIADAGEVLNGIFYPGNYYSDYEMATVFLDTAHQVAVKRYLAGDSSGAIEIMDEGFNAFAETLGNDWYMQFASREDYEQSDFAKYMDFTDFSREISNYGFFLGVAGRTEDADAVFDYVLLVNPDEVSIYLNLADALWEYGETEEARSYYNKYALMIQNMGLSAHIPDRVWERGGK